jgi:hypothetical protein
VLDDFRTTLIVRGGSKAIGIVGKQGEENDPDLY